MLLLLLAVLSSAVYGSTANAQEPPRLAVHLADMGKALGDRKATIESKLKAFEAATGHQVFVLTVPSTGSRSIEEYAVEVFKKSKIGRSKLDDGVLFMVSTGERKMRIEVGYGLEGVLTDAKCSRIVHDVAAPLFAQGRLEEGIEAGVDAVIGAIDPAHGDNSPSASPPVQQPQIPSYVWVAAGIFLLLVFGIMAVGGGAIGLVVLAVLMLFFSFHFRGAEGKLYSAGMFVTWFFARWQLVANNVRRYHITPSTNRFLTWVWCFLLMPGSGAPRRKGEADLVTYSFSFGASKSSSDSTDDDVESCGGGGRSGGAGASGQW